MEGIFDAYFDYIMKIKFRVADQDPTFYEKGIRNWIVPKHLVPDLNLEPCFSCTYPMDFAVFTKAVW